MIDLTLRCPVCGLRADQCFDHGDDWKKRPPTSVHQMTDAQLRAGVNEFTEDDPPPYASCTCPAGSYDYPNAVHEPYCRTRRPWHP